MAHFLLRTTLGLLVAVSGIGSMAEAHCEVPCGIYTDQLRFGQMLEDQATIAKAVTEIGELAEKNDPLSHNQLARWVATKDTHATNIQHIVAEYFLTQRIKPGTDAASNQTYAEQLKAAHAVLLAAMKCKQTVDPAAGDTLKQAILDLHQAYEGRVYQRM